MHYAYNMWNGFLFIGFLLANQSLTDDHPLLKATYTRPEITSVGNVDFSPRLAETKRDQQLLEKSGL